MAGERLDNAKESLKEQIKLIPEGSIISLITFETEIEDVMVNVTVDDNTRQEMLDKVSGLVDKSTTSLYAALQRGIELAKEYKGPLKIKKIILVSDGEPTDVVVKAGDDQDPNYQQYFDLARLALEYKTSIDTVGALGEHNVYLMYEIAKRSTGKYIFAENEEELKDKMIIATEQTMKIAFSQPTLTVKTKLSDSISEMTLELEDAAQYKPTVIRMPFEKMNEGEFQSFYAEF